MLFNLIAMEGKRFLGHYLIWVILLLGQLQGCKTCIEKERKALLELKKYLISKSSESSYKEETGGTNLDFVLPTWTNDTKSVCCRWKGVDCNRTSGRVTGISIGEMYIRDSLLNLSLLHPFEELRSLNLSPDGNVIRFSFNGFFDDVEGYKSLGKLKYLETLDLSSNAFTEDIFPFLDAVTSLTTLNLRSNLVTPYRKEPDNFGFGHLSNGSIRVLTHLKNLKALDLGENESSSLILQDLKNLTNLEVLGLANNFFLEPTQIEVICEMKNLRELDLRRNYLVGEIPLCFGSLNKLRVLDLSYNQLSGNIPSSFSSLESLEYLSLLDNNFTGLFSLNPLTNLAKLKVFKVSSTSGKVQVEMESNWQPKFQLSVAILRSCSLEKIPSFLLYQENLRLLDISSNKLSGDIPTWLLANNPKLKVLQLQNNVFTVFQMPAIVHNLQVLDFSANGIGGMFPDNICRALPNLVEMNASSNGFQGEFPSSMGEMKNISFLDLSYNNFSGKLPRSFFTGCFSLKYLRLSHNKFIGHFLPRGTSFNSLRMLRIDNNLFTGNIRVGLLSSTVLSMLDMSNNCLTGAIPSWISKLSRLDFLSLSNNFLERTIPPSLVDLSSLWFLDLSGNVLSGALPSHMAVRYLFLHNNSFTGPISSFLDGRVLSLWNNKLSGSIPQFVNSPDIRILLLRGNSLTGYIPRELCDLSNIEVLDLSNNKLNGFIPPCLSNLSFGVTGKDHKVVSYTTSIYLERFKLEFYKFTFVVEKLVLQEDIPKEIEINFAAKRRYESYSGSGRSWLIDGILDYMYGMDLSNNELSGVIPVELGDLPYVNILNLSHNFLSSSIPLSFSNLKAVESLDLSYNNLHGSIPYQLANLTFLAVFDVSHNNLSGIIPQGRQFNTFNESSYLGNPFLCGPPTNISCEPKKSSEEANNGGGEEEENEVVIDRLVFYYSTASVYVTALIGIVVLMCFDCPWRRAWFRIVDAFIASAKSMLF